MSNDTIHNIALDALLTKELEFDEKLNDLLAKLDGNITDSRRALLNRIVTNIRRAKISLENTVELLERDCDRVAETIEHKLQVALEALGFTSARIAVSASEPCGNYPGAMSIGGIMYVNQFTTIRTNLLHDGTVDVSIHGPDATIEKPSWTITPITHDQAPTAAKIIADWIGDYVNGR